MEIDIIIFKDGLYHLWPYKYGDFKLFNIRVYLNYCDALRESWTNITLYNDEKQ